MIADIFRAFVSAYLAPQQSAAQILSSRAGFFDALLMAVLGYLLTMIILMVTPGVTLPPAPGLLDRHILGLIYAFIGFFIYSGLISFFGRVSGATGTREQSQVIVAWHSIVTAPLSVPVQMMIAGFNVEERGDDVPLIETPDAGTIILGAAAILVSFWILANYIYVLHRFRNFWGVVAVVVGLPIGLGFFMFNAVGTLSALQQGMAQ